MTFEGKSVAVVVPAFNEERLIATTISTMPPFVDRIFVIDDASKDATAERAKAVGDDRVTVITHRKNTGVGGAILDGHREVLREGYDISVVMAGDAQMPPAYLAALLTPLVSGEADFAKGNRFSDRESMKGMPKIRVFGSVVLSLLTKIASGYWHLFDPQNGYTAISRTVLEKIDFDEISSGYAFENSLLIHANIVGARAVDVPIPAVYGEEVSTMRLSTAGPAILWVLFVGFWKRIFRRHVSPVPTPVGLLVFGSLFAMVIGVGVGAFATWYSLGEDSASAGTVLLAVGSVLVGVQLALVALVIDYQESRAQKK